MAIYHIRRLFACGFWSKNWIGNDENQEERPPSAWRDKLHFRTVINGGRNCDSNGRIGRFGAMTATVTAGEN